MQSRDVETSVRAMQLFAKVSTLHSMDCLALHFCDDNACQILCLIMAYLAFEFAIFCKNSAHNQFFY